MKKYIFPESEEIARKNNGKDLDPDDSQGSLDSHIVERGFLVIQDKVRKVYYNCKDCGDSLDSKVLKAIGRCMACERG